VPARAARCCDYPRGVTDYIVIRPAPDAPAFFLPANLDGRWLDTRTASAEDQVRRTLGLLSRQAVATDRTETRGDGAVAQVWEVRPVDE